MTPSLAITPQPAARPEYRVFRSVNTRWEDNDSYGHVNNVVYFSWFDTAVNAYLMERGVLDIHGGPIIGLVVENHCNYFRPLAFPQTVEIGLRVEHIGRRSVRYGLAVFGPDQDAAQTAVAQGHFVHVYVDAESRQPRALPPSWRTILEHLQ